MMQILAKKYTTAVGETENLDSNKNCLDSDTKTFFKSRLLQKKLFNIEIKREMDTRIEKWD
jgi:hypothetical protein